MVFADEVRDLGEVDKGQDVQLTSSELELAQDLVVELPDEAFQHARYSDEYKGRLLEVLESKVEGMEVSSLAPQAQRTQVIDLMEALMLTLGSRGSAADEARAGRRAKPAPVEKLEKKPAARARQKDTAEPREKKVQGGKQIGRAHV